MDAEIGATDLGDIGVLSSFPSIDISTFVSNILFWKEILKLFQLYQLQLNSFYFPSFLCLKENRNQN